MCRCVMHITDVEGIPLSPQPQSSSPKAPIPAQRLCVCEEGLQCIGAHPTPDTKANTEAKVSAIQKVPANTKAHTKPTTLRLKQVQVPVLLDFRHVQERQGTEGLPFKSLRWWQEALVSCGQLGMRYGRR